MSCSKTSSASSCESDFFKDQPMLLSIRVMDISFECKDKSYVMFSSVT